MRVNLNTLQNMFYGKAVNKNVAIPSSDQAFESVKDLLRNKEKAAGILRFNIGAVFTGEYGEELYQSLHDCCPKTSAQQNCAYV